MTVTVASGKGGTGKTTVAVSLATLLAASGRKVRYIDCDVEEPNGHLFLNPRLRDREPFCVPTPVVDEEECRSCGLCGDACRFNAIAVLARKVLTYPELCHGCGGCAVACPFDAIDEKKREVGEIERGASDGITFAHGRLNVGEARSAPLVAATKKEARADHEINIVDAPPGNACPVIAALRGSDFVLLVTDPTPFGLSDLAITIDTVRVLGLSHGVVVNRATEGNDAARVFCRDRHISILCEIPDDRRVAEAYSRGELPVHAVPGYADRIREILTAIPGAAG